MVATQSAQTRSGCRGSDNPGTSARCSKAREVFSPSRMPTHGPRVTTRARSKRGSDAGAIDVRARTVRFDLDRGLECPANYGVPTSGRTRFFLHRISNLTATGSSCVLYLIAYQFSTGATAVYQWQRGTSGSCNRCTAATPSIHLQRPSGTSGTASGRSIFNTGNACTYSRLAREVLQ